MHISEKCYMKLRRKILHDYRKGWDSNRKKKCWIYNIKNA